MRHLRGYVLKVLLLWNIWLLLLAEVVLVVAVELVDFLQAQVWLLFPAHRTQLLLVLVEPVN
jgi:hypothetical protein